MLRFRDGWEPPALAAPSRDQDLTRLAESLASDEELQVRGATSASHSRSFDSELTFVVSVQMLPPADGFAFTNTSYKRMQVLDQDTAVSCRVDR